MMLYMKKEMRISKSTSSSSFAITVFFMFSSVKKDLLQNYEFLEYIHILLKAFYSLVNNAKIHSYKINVI